MPSMPLRNLVLVLLLMMKHTSWQIPRLIPSPSLPVTTCMPHRGSAPYRSNAGFIPPNHWVHDLEQGGGRIIGEGCHFIDFLTFLVGQPPIAVTAQALPDGGRYREDKAVFTFT